MVRVDRKFRSLNKKTNCNETNAFIPSVLQSFYTSFQNLFFKVCKILVYLLRFQSPRVTKISGNRGVFLGFFFYILFGVLKDSPPLCQVIKLPLLSLGPVHQIFSIAWTVIQTLTYSSFVYSKRLKNFHGSATHISKQPREIVRRICICSLT